MDITNLVVGSVLPVFTPVQADLKKRTLVPVRNVKVVEAYTTGDSNLTIKVAKDSLAYQGYVHRKRKERRRGSIYRQVNQGL
ncbi:head fiber protein [Bacteroides fragilis]|nr:head fiber protein [Bacteroides fragilis]